MGSTLLAVLLVDRARLLWSFGVRFTDEDQTLLWYATRDLLHGRLREPYFYGQTYGSWLEAALAAPLHAAGIPLWIALPLSGMIFGLLPWLLLAILANRRGHSLLMVALLAAATATSLEGEIIASLPRGLLPGILLAIVGVVVALWPGKQERSFTPAFVLGIAMVLGASFNQTSALISGPAAAFLVLQRIQQRAKAWMAGISSGVALGLAGHWWAQAFYAFHPALGIHPAASLTLRLSQLMDTASHAARYLGAFGPELVPSAFVPLFVFAVVAAALASRQGPAGGGAAAVSLLLIAAIAASPKAADGTPSVFFPYSRFYMAFPWMVAVLAILAADSPRTSPAWRLTGNVAAGVFVAVAVGSAVLRAATFSARLVQLQAVAARGPHVLPRPVDELRAQCRERERVAVESGARVIVERYDRVAAYGCGALLYDRVATLFPLYERRPWSFASSIGPVIVSDAGPGACRKQAATELDCKRVGTTGRLMLVSGYRGPLKGFLEQIGSGY